MRLYKQELKRLFLMKRTKVIFLIAILISILFAVLASEFSGANVPNGEGGAIWLHGTGAISFLERASSEGNGEITLEGLKAALQKYQDLYHEYEMDPLKPGMSEGKFPLDVYWEQVYPIAPLLRILRTAYGTNEKQADLMALKQSDIDRFYAACEARLEDAMKSDEVLNNPAYISKAKAIYNRVEKPYIVSHGYTRDAFDYISFTILLLVLLSAVMIAPVFSERYESGEDSVIRCTEFGRGKLVSTTILAVVTVSSLLYFLGIGAHLLVSDMIFGKDTLRESVQVLYTVYSLPALDLLGLQIALALTGWLCCIAITVMAACISAIMRETATAMVISIIVVVLPTFLYMGVGNVNWLSALLPSAAVGLQNNMLYSLVDLRFLMMGGVALWYPVVLVITEIIETVVFVVFAHFAYVRHQVR